MSQSERTSKGFVRGYFFDKSVIVTGASSGIGHDVALAFSEQGARVAVMARRRAHLDQLARKIDKAGGEALAPDCDVTAPARVFFAGDQAKASFVTIEILTHSTRLLVS